MLFPLGQIVVTQGIQDALTAAEIAECLRRHARGDWGELDEDDKRENARSLRHGYRLLSAYTVRGIKVWVITEADRSVTTVLLPEEY